MSNRDLANDQPELLDLVKSKYEETSRHSEFKEEEGVLQRLCTELPRELQPLRILKPLGIGSTALVFEVHDERLDRRTALKLPRPRLGKIDSVVKVIRGERSLLAGLNHQNLIKVHLVGEIQFTHASADYVFPYFLMDFVEGVEDLDDFVKKNAPASDELVLLLRGLASGVSYLHANRIIHCDVKPANLLVAPGKPPLITDLGYAKNFPPSHAGPQDETTVTYTYHYAHPDLRSRMRRVPDPDAAESRLGPSDLRDAFDLYAFGKTIQKVLRDVREMEAVTGARPLLTPYQWRYLQMVSTRLLDGRVERETGDPLDSDVISGLPRSFMDEVKYTSAEEVVEDLDKLLNVYDLEAEVPELSDRSSAYIQVPEARVPLTSRVRAVLGHQGLARLAQITQLGFISLVYPGATHSRLEHTLGVFQQCCEILRALWHDSHNGFFRAVMSSKDLSSALAAALLHDIGQYPMAHDLSEMAPEFSHERFTEAVMYGVPDSSGFSLADVLRDVWRVDPEQVIRILSLPREAGIKTRLLHSVVSGPLDCDKLDYLLRDSVHAGVVFGNAIDRGRLYRNLTVAIRSQDGQSLDVAEMGVTEKALAVADGIWRARRDMFRQVYWHHTARALKAMLAYAVRTTLRSENDEASLQFWSDFVEFVKSPMNAWGSSSPRESLNGEGDDADSALIAPNPEAALRSSYLAPSDEALLDFLECRAPAPAQEMIQLMRDRRLYKRWDVISYSADGRGEEAASYYDKFRALVQVGSHGQIEAWREEQQRDREVAFKDLIGEKRLLELQDELKAPLLLLDVPLKSARSAGAGETLYYVPEEELRLEPGAGIRLPRPTDSRIEVRREIFDKDVGKIRILVHPQLYKELREAGGFFR